MGEPVFLVTGAGGCLGSWVLRNLLDSNTRAVAADLSTERARARLLMTDDELDRVDWCGLDVTDTAAVDRLVSEREITHIVHLAGLQIPFCKADPARGAAVNVTGTVNLLEAARRHGIGNVCYASSLAALGPDECYPDKPVVDDVPLLPMSLYGVYKAANEATAKIYWQDWQVGSVGLRPYIVYGVARDQGMTSDIARAVLAAAAGRPFHIRFDGPVALQYADDTAQIFIAAAAAGHRGAAACNLRGDVVEVQAFIDTLRQACPSAKISCESGARLPFPADLDDSGLRSIIGEVPHTPLAAAINADLERFESLLSAGKVDLAQLDQ